MRHCLACGYWMREREGDPDYHPDCYPGEKARITIAMAKENKRQLSAQTERTDEWYETN